MTPLEKYRLSEGLSYSGLASLLQRPTETVRRWCLDLAEPRKKEREVIQRKTKGKVIANPVLTFKP